MDALIAFNKDSTIDLHDCDLDESQRYPCKTLEDWGECHWDILVDFLQGNWNRKMPYIITLEDMLKEREINWIIVGKIKTEHVCRCDCH